MKDQRCRKGISQLFFNLGARLGWLVKATPWSLYHTDRNPVPIASEAGWAPGAVWSGAEYLAPTDIPFPDRPSRTQLLYTLSCPGPCMCISLWFNYAQLFLC
jgi:hypothetical protein